MLKKIHIEAVGIGMYVHELCGSWMEHPFWKKSFLVDNAQTLKAIRECGIQELWIDVSKGEDVAADAGEFSEQDESIKIDEALGAVSANERTDELRVGLGEEMEHARNVLARSKRAVTSMFQEARMGKALQITETEALVDEISQSVMRNPNALFTLVRLKTKDDYTYLHSVAVCAFMLALGRQLGLQGEILKQAGVAGLLHDIGKSMVPEEVLNKPDCLTHAEFEIMKQHPRNGWRLLKESQGISAIVLDVCLHHHERLNGHGYPDKLREETISQFARMGAVCDVYDAITSVRCYKNAWEPAEAIRKMAEWKDGNYDESVFYAFVKTVGIYPVGSLLLLESGRLALVVEQSAASLLKPKVIVFYSARYRDYMEPELLDLSGSDDAIAGIESAAAWKFAPTMLQELMQLHEVSNA